MFNTKIDRLKIVLDLSKKLKFFKGRNNENIDLYNDMYSFIRDFKKICNDYRECENKSYTFSNSTEKTWICEPREIPLDGTQKSKTIYYS